MTSDLDGSFIDLVNDVQRRARARSDATDIALGDLYEPHPDAADYEKTVNNVVRAIARERKELVADLRLIAGMLPAIVQAAAGEEVRPEPSNAHLFGLDAENQPLPATQPAGAGEARDG